MGLQSPAKPRRATLAVVTMTTREAPGISSHGKTGRSLCEEIMAYSHLRNGPFLGQRLCARSGRMARMPEESEDVGHTFPNRSDEWPLSGPLLWTTGFWDFVCGQCSPCTCKCLSGPMPLCPSLQLGPLPHHQNGATTLPGQASSSAQRS